MKLRIDKVSDPNIGLDFIRVKSVEFSKNYIGIIFESEEVAREAYDWIWNGNPESELFKDLAHNASLFPAKKSIGFSQFFDYVFTLVD